MNLNTAIARATDHFLKSDKARTYKGETMRFERVSYDAGDYLECQTWGYDYEAICIPEDRPELIRYKFYAQRGTSVIAQIATRYYLDILRREAK